MTLQPCETVQLLREISYMAVRILTPSAWQSDVFAPELRTSAHKYDVNRVGARLGCRELPDAGRFVALHLHYAGQDRSAEKVGATLGKDSIWGGCVG